MKALQTDRAKFRAVTKIVKTRHVIFGILPCVKTTPLKQDANFGRTCFFRHVEAEEKPSKNSKKGGAKRSVVLLKDSTKLGCVSQDSYPRKSSTCRRKIGIKTRRQILQGHLAPKKRDRKWFIARKSIKCEPHERGPCAPIFGKDHMRRHCTKKDAPAE